MEICKNTLIDTMKKSCVNFNENDLYIENSKLIYKNTLKLDSRKKFKKLPFKIDVIYGEFLCSDIGISSFDNFPEVVYGNIDVSKNRIESLFKFNTQTYGCLNISHNDICNIKINEFTKTDALNLFYKDKFKLILSIKW